MKKIIAIAILACLVAGVTFAQDKEAKVSGSIVSKTDFVFPQEGKSKTTEVLSMYWQYKRLGGGLDVVMDPKNDFFQTEPYLTFNKGPWYLLGGAAINSAGNRWAQTGGWYINKFGRFNLVIDVRNYWGLNSQSVSFLDTFGEATYDLSEKLFAGLDVEYVHWWKGKSHNRYFVGPVLGYKVIKNLTVFVRPSREWDALAGSTKYTDKVRIGLKFCF